MKTVKANEIFKKSRCKAEAYLVEDCDIHLPDRSGITNKSDAGRVLAIGGGRGMAGAVTFCAEAAYRSGAGLVEILTHPDNRIPVQILIPEAIVSFWNEFRTDKSCNAIALGMGMGRSDEASRIVERALYARKPKVVDADALNIISQNKDMLGLCDRSTVLTPHVGEFARLSGKNVWDIKDDPVTSALELAETYGTNVVLKDSITVIVTHDLRVYINTAGDSTLSKGGSGDILAGITASLIAQGMEAAEAAYTAPFILGRAGERTGARLGVRGGLARDVIAEIPMTIKEY